MAKITFKGLEDYELRLSRLSQGAEEIAGKSIYAGAAIVADAVRENIQRLDARPDREGLVAYHKKEPPPLTQSQKQGLLDGFGVSSLQDDRGYLNVKLGFDGYNKLRTKSFPKGQPNVMIARSLESGSSISPKRPFVRPAVNASRQAAEEAMAKVLDEEIEKIMT